MNGRLVVSLTSHPPRYSHLRECLESLLAQSHKPDAIVLWLAPDEWQVLPQDIKDMNGISFAVCEDLKSYKNIIPALEKHPQAYIVIAADDVAYPPSWLQRFVEEYRSDKEILCQFARIMRPELPYSRWDVVRAPVVGSWVFPGGFRGVMYPPGSLHSDVMDVEALQRLAPHADDIWKYWHGLRAGSTHRYIQSRERFKDLLSGSVGLWSQHNGDGGNDRQFVAMVEAYGRPWLSEVAA